MATYRYQGNVMQGTVKPAMDFNPEQDATALRTAMKGMGSDEMAIADIIVHRSNQQRQQIAQTFKAKYGKDLVKELKSELKGDMENLILSLMVPSGDFDAVQLKKAMKGLGTDEDALTETMCTKNNTEMTMIKQAYTRLYGGDLTKDIGKETSGPYKKILVSLSMGGRQEHMALDLDKARQDAEALYVAGEKKLGTDESEFNCILAFQSYPQLMLVCEEYRKISKYSLEESLKREMSGDLLKAMLTIMKCAQNKIEYYAEKLNKAMKGLGTDDKALVRILVGRSEVDLELIKQHFFKMFSKPLGGAIKAECSGSYKKALLLLIKE